MEFRGGQNDDLWNSGGAKLSLTPLFNCAYRGTGVLCAGKKKKVLVSTVCAYAGFHETVNYTGYFCHN